MPVEKDPSGQRSVHAEAEVPGTPEEVWRAIATGPGMSAWFVPSTCEERAGGVVTNNFGPGMESVAALKTWNPPPSFSAETEEEPGKIATEWTVEAKDGGTCVVRVVHRGRSDGARPLSQAPCPVFDCTCDHMVSWPSEYENQS